jgi:hypothetical protein
VELSKEVLDLFEFILVTSMGRSLKPQDESTKIKLKETNKQQLMPSLERIESVVDVDATLQLLSQAYEIIFKELSSFVEFAQRFDGINWKIYVRLMNRFRKTGAYFKTSDDPFAGIIDAPAAAGSGAGLFDDNYGNEYDNNNNYGQDYEGGEKEPTFVDIEQECS